MSPLLSISRRTRSTPFTSRVEADGVKAYTVYNHMLLPTVFQSIEEDYWHLCEHVQVWDVSVERQVAIEGSDAYRLIQLMTPRDLSKAQTGKCFYVPLCDADGGVVNDPIAIKLDAQTWWLSIADSDVILWAKGLATGMQLDVKISEPDIWPLAVQGPKAEALMTRVFGEQVRDIRFFNIRPLAYQGIAMQVARSGWSKQGGFEIYVNDIGTGQALWDELFIKGQDLQVRAGCPNGIERIENGLLSFGNDIDFSNNPFEARLDQYVDIDADIDSLSLSALKHIHSQTHNRRKLLGLVLPTTDKVTENVVTHNNGLNPVAEIRSLCFSPRYQVQLGFALVELSKVSIGDEIQVSTESGTQTAIVCDLPFDFEHLGLVSHPRKHNEG